METFFDKVAEINSSVNSVVWGKYGLILLVGTGILMTVVTKVFQVTHIGHWWKNTIGSLFSKNVIGHSKENGTISSGELTEGEEYIPEGVMDELDNKYKQQALDILNDPERRAELGY